MRLALPLLALLLLAAPAWADDPAPQASGDAARLTIAMSGIVVVGAGFSMMLYAHDRTGHSEPGLLVGGVVVVAAGVTMTWLGLRSRTVVVAPVVTRHTRGATATLRWGAGARGPRVSP